MKKSPLIFVVLASLVVMTSTQAQKLPAPSRTVFKCEIAGKVTYSDEPCLGAKRLDVEPTRGLSKSSGREKVGADVQQEKYNEQMTEAFRPILGETAEERAKRHRRFTLTPQDRAQCGNLDSEISATEKAEARATKAELPSTQQSLLKLRKQYRFLRC